MRLSLLLVVLLAFAVAPARAQWLRLDFSFSASPNNAPELVSAFEVGGAHGWFQFDTDRAPIDSGPLGIIYEIDSFEVSRFLASASGSQMGSLTERDAVARFKAAPDFDFYALQIFDKDDNALVSLQMFVADGSVFDGITLPDAPASYDAPSAGGGLQFIGVGGIAQVFDDGDFGFRYRVTETGAPTPKPCSEVDLAEPFGVLDFDDVLAFLIAFAPGCP